MNQAHTGSGMTTVVVGREGGTAAAHRDWGTELSPSGEL